MLNRVPRVRRRSFTLAELLVSIAIVAMLSATSLMMLYGVQEHARLARTRGTVARIHVVIMEKWDEFLTRPVPIRVLPTDSVAIASGKRLNGLRELMRMTLPDRKSDLVDPAVVLVQPGSAGTPLPVSKWMAYRRKAQRLVQAAKGTGVDWRDNTAGWTRAHQGSECLYLIFSTIRDGDTTALDNFAESEIADTDGDGIPEILDGWGRPVEFLRWAPGFVTLMGDDGAWGQFNIDDDGNGTIDDEMEAGFPGTDDRSELQVRNSTAAPDPFDPRKIDTRGTFALVPLVYSAGPDGVYDIVSDFPVGHRASQTVPQNDPYVVHTASNLQMGRPADADDPLNTGTPDGVLQCWDNITNHLVQIQ